MSKENLADALALAIDMAARARLTAATAIEQRDEFARLLVNLIERIGDHGQEAKAVREAGEFMHALYGPSGPPPRKVVNPDED